MKLQEKGSTVIGKGVDTDVIVASGKAYINALNKLEFVKKSERIRGIRGYDMGMTMTEKILAGHAGKDHVTAGEIVEARIDIALANDITAPLSLEEFEKSGAKSVFDPERIVFVLDHFTPNKDILSAENCKIIREFAPKYGITHFYEGGACGIEHALLPEQGLVVPGDVVVGADSHTCTYGALGAFSTGVGSTDLTYAMVMGSLWFKVPESIKFVCTGKWQRWVTGKDLILYIIGLIGVEGARYRGDGV